ncbi:MAG: hypothetical protein MJ231_05395 [bacterium]|nr:hypothetical protein [bacterium]
MKKLFLTFLFAMFIITPSFASNWIEVSTGVFVDGESIEPYINDFGNEESDKYIFWTKRMNNNGYKYTSLESYYKKKIEYFVDKEIIDFTHKRIAIKSNCIYGVNSELINRFDYANQRIDWKYIIPDTPEQELYKEVLKTKISVEKERKRLEDLRLEEERKKAEAEAEKLEEMNNPKFKKR